MDKNEKIKLEDAAWNRINELIKSRGIKQAQLLQMCKEVDMPVSQPELSKLYSGKKKINIYELAAISKALDVSVDFLMSDFISYREDLLSDVQSKKLLSKTDNEEFASYFGDYNVYYNATTEQEDKIQKGRMVISEDRGLCKVKVLIDTGTYRGEKEIVKKYEGRMLIAPALSSAYIVLRNDSIGELCYMAMRHRTFIIKQLECRMALCLTIGAGESKLPTVHRILISRSSLSDKQIFMIQPYLNLYGNEIRI